MLHAELERLVGAVVLDFAWILHGQRGRGIQAGNGRRIALDPPPFHERVAAGKPDGNNADRKPCQPAMHRFPQPSPQVLEPTRRAHTTTDLIRLEPSKLGY